MFIHDIIKIKYTNLGYLPDNPYYLISDKEMLDAFINDNKECVFFDYYYCPDPSFQQPYDELVDYIKVAKDQFIAEGKQLPSWIYSYMLLRPITYDSDEADISYLCELAHVQQNNALAQFDLDVATACYDVSKKWILKQRSKQGDRPPTMFGETHVTKSLRLDQANILLDENIV